MKRLLACILLAACVAVLPGPAVRAADVADEEENLETKTYDVSFLRETATEPVLGREPIWECWPWPEAKDRPPVRERGIPAHKENRWEDLLRRWMEDELVQEPESVDVKFSPPRRVT